MVTPSRPVGQMVLTGDGQTVPGQARQPGWRIWALAAHRISRSGTPGQTRLPQRRPPVDPDVYPTSFIRLVIERENYRLCLCVEEGKEREKTEDSEDSERERKGGELVVVVGGSWWRRNPCFKTRVLKQNQTWPQESGGCSSLLLD
jgi:hypothetical protein